MRETWFTIAALALATVVLRGIGPVALRGRELPKRAREAAVLLAPVLFAAFVATQVFSTGRSLVVDERALGLAAAGAAVLVRAPTPVVLLAAAAAVAVTRAIA